MFSIRHHPLTTLTVRYKSIPIHSNLSFFKLDHLWKIVSVLDELFLYIFFYISITLWPTYKSRKVPQKVRRKIKRRGIWIHEKYRIRERSVGLPCIFIHIKKYHIRDQAREIFDKPRFRNLHVGTKVLKTALLKKQSYTWNYNEIKTIY